MKKILKVVLGLFTVLLFAACNNGSNDADNLARILQIIENTPDAPIDRNVELTGVSEQQVEKGQNYDFSAQTGKKAFLVVMNQYPNQEVNVFSSNTVEITPSDIYDYKFENENGVFYNVPFNPPMIDYNPVSDTEPFFSSNNAFTPDFDDVIPTTRGSHHDFYAATKDNLTNDNWASNAELKVIGQHCYVWYKAKDGIEVTEDKLQTLANTFDDIFEKETYIFGKNYPVNGTIDGYFSDTIKNKYIGVDENTKVNIIVYDLFNDYEETKAKRAGTLGYFWSLDFYKNNITKTSGGKTYTLKTNKCECLHMDSFFLQEAAEHQQSTIAHEFQHLLNFVNKTLQYGEEYKSWFTEMMSMVCEDIMQTQIGLEDSASPKGRLATFNGGYNKGFTNWLDGDDVYYSYANAYAFGAYLVRNYGIDFIKELAQNNKVEVEAISDALVATGAPENSFYTAYKKFYNVVLNPKSSNYTLNKQASKTYTYATGKSATFTCTPINLFDYVTVSAKYVKGDYVTNLYQASKLNDYKGPVILNSRLYSSLDPTGMFVSYLGTVGTDKDQLNPSFHLPDSASSNQNVIYRMVFAN